MKKERLKLEDLKVKSFVTSLEKTQKQTIEGGSIILTVLTVPSVSVIVSCSISAVSNVVKTQVETANERTDQQSVYFPPYQETVDGCPVSNACPYSYNCPTDPFCGL